MKNQKLLFIKLSLAFASLLSGTGVVHAEEVPAGYVVNKANLSAADNQTFEGHNLGAMITPVMHKLISELGLTLKLAHSKPVAYAPSTVAMTEKYSKYVKYDRATRKISGYVGGVPFPDLSDSDPDLADKLIWNHVYGDSIFSDNLVAGGPTFAIDATKGLERSFSLVNMQIKLTHRTSMEPVAPKFIGDGSVYKKVLLFNLAPQDIAGTGAYIQRYDDGRLDDSWAYIKSIRRIRRMSGGTWMDPIPGTDIVNDDSGCHDAFPTWYPKYKLVGKRWMLAVVHGNGPGEGYKTEYAVDTKTPPYWNPINQPWEPREVYVIDAFPPATHPYGRKRLYHDIQGRMLIWCDMYDKKDTLWKMFQLPVTQSVLVNNGEPVMSSVYDWAVDFQRLHSTYIEIGYWRQNEARMDPSEWAPESLTAPERLTTTSLFRRFGPPTIGPR